VHGKRVVPAKVSAAGYQFRFPALEAALRDIIGEEPAA
jgi:NAD dependent epimerase/dehydratase family enzyme